MPKINGMRFCLAIILSLFFNVIHCQTDNSSEIGVDLNFGTSNLSGSAGLGLKYGLNLNEKVIVGPSFRYQRFWSNYYGVKSTYNIAGGGIFTHVRFYNYFFVGAELEFLKTPFNYNNGSSVATSKMVPTCFVGGGFSRLLSEKVRINAGIMFDIVNHINSPFRPTYFMKKENGAYIPAIYRLAFFFPLNHE